MKAIARTTTNTGSALRKATRRFSTSRSVSDAGKVVVGVRREDPNRIWERRCPVTPDAVNELVRDGVEVLVQPCERRVWSDDEFVKAGAKIHPTLHPANILVGIKEIPIPELDGGLLSSVNGRPRTHVMFSHTAKGQLYNMPLLSRFVGETETDGPQLVDYELLTGEDGKRVVGFGWFAGAAGVIEGLTASAHDFLSLGISSPFLYLPRPYSHPNLEDMRKSLRSVGEMISTKGMPRSTGPFVIAVTGNGNVATGALDLIKELPVTFVKAEDLPALVSNPDADLRKIYVVHVQSASYLVNNQNKPFDRADYYANPTNYESLFFEKIAPYTSLLINGVGWSQSFPRLLSTAQLSKTIQLAKSIGRTRFRTIADITCDLSGGIEFVNRACTIDDPFFYTDGKGKPKQVEDGVQVMSIDILPSELPLDASKHFSKAFRPYLGAMVRKYQGKNTEEDAKALEAIERATIAQHGQLKPRHQWLTPLIDSHGVEGVNQKTATVTSTVSDKVDLDVKADLGGLESSAPSSGTAAGILKKKNVLLLGSGMVAKPAVDEFLQREDINLVVASNNFAEAEQLIRGSDSASAVFLDVSDNAVLSRLISDADVVVSLLPAPLHPPVGEICIDKKKHLVTASYISPAMRELSQKAQAADVLLLNEIGLDPGIDHCSAIDMRTKIEAQGRKIASFVSWCGGLPAPEHSDAPLGMKFSWSPKGLLSAALNDAEFKLGGKPRKISGTELLSSSFRSVPLYKGFAFEGLANRNSFPYAETYGLGSPKELHHLFRGTLRYRGFSRTLEMFRRMGLLSSTSEKILLADNPSAYHKGWHSLVETVLAKLLSKDRVKGPNEGYDMLKAVIGKDSAQEIWPILQELHMVPNPNDLSHVDLPPVPKVPLAPLDLLTVLLSHQLRYREGERDMVVLSHQIVSVPKNCYVGDGEAFKPGSDVDALTHTATLVTYGTPSKSTSAMSRTVGLPLAFATLQVLDGHVKERGVKGPCDAGKEVWGGVLEGLETVGLGMKETVRRGGYMPKWW